MPDKDSTYRQQVIQCAKAIRERLGSSLPNVALLTGTGLAQAAAAAAVRISIPYEELPHFPVSTVESHPGRLLFGALAGRPVLILQGRIHLYEGYTPRQVTFPIRVLRELGVQSLILSNAAGGLNPFFKAGDIMLIADHLNLTGENPLVGQNETSWGVRFPDMTAAYDRDLARLAERAAADAGLTLPRGIYAGLKGPSLETPAEVRYLRGMGADAVGFSTVQEVIAAVHGGMRVLGLSVITNAHDPDAPAPASMEEILSAAADAAARLASVMAGVVERVATDGDNATGTKGT